MVNCRWSDQFKMIFGLNYRKSGTGRSPIQKAATDPVLQLPVIPVRRGVIAEKALNRRHTLNQNRKPQPPPVVHVIYNVHVLAIVQLSIAVASKTTCTKFSNLNVIKVGPPPRKIKIFNTIFVRDTTFLSAFHNVYFFRIIFR